MIAVGMVLVDGTVVVFEGTDGEDLVTFAVDRRIAMDLARAIEAEGPVPVEVEPWQVLGRWSGAAKG